jgi:hypothetical protein
VKNQVSVLLSPDCQRFNAQLIRSLVPETPFKTRKKPNKSKKQLASTNEETHGNTKRKLANRSNNSQEKHGKPHRIQEKLNKQQGQPWDFRWEIGNFIHQKPQQKPSSRQDRNHRWVKLSIKN